MNCQICMSACIRKGVQKNGTQKFKCIGCKKYQQATYIYKAYTPEVREQIKPMVKRGLGILDMAYLLKIGKNTVIRYVKAAANEIARPDLKENGQEYEADELHTQIQVLSRESIYVSYVINSKTRKVLNYSIGKRDKEHLQKMLLPVLSARPQKVYTDKWSSYPAIIPLKLHCSRKHCINVIERNHWTMRIRLKRFNRNPVYCSRSIEMLDACLRIYFWG